MELVFIEYQSEDYQNILKLGCSLLGFSSYKVFLKNKERSGISLPVSFSAWFLKKNVSLVMFYYLTKFHCLTAFTSWDIDKICIVIVCSPGRDVINFKINLIFLIKPFFPHGQKQNKNVNIWRTKGAFKMK